MILIERIEPDQYQILDVEGVSISPMANINEWHFVAEDCWFPANTLRLHSHDEIGRVRIKIKFDTKITRATAVSFRVDFNFGRIDAWVKLRLFT